jgi:tetratricopeptide (TPR) repeat protein
VAKPTFAKDKGKADTADLLAEPQGLVVRAADALRPHIKAIAFVLLGLAAVIVALAVWSSVNASRAETATASFGKLVAEATATVDQAGPQIELLDPSDPTGGIKPAKYKTFEERTQATLALASTLDFPSDKVEKNARLVQAGLLYDAGKYDDAVAAYRAFIDSLGGADPGAALALRAREGIGYAIEAKALAQTDAAARNAGLDEALKAFSELAPDDKDPRHSLGLFHQARLRALKGDKPGAVELYKKALEKQPDPELTDEINNRLALLEAK